MKGENNMSENNSMMDKLMAFVDVIAGPLTKFGNIPFVRAIVNGMVASSGVTMIGSVFLVLNLLGNPTGGLAFGGKALLPFLTPLADQLGLVNSLTMGLMAVYMVIAMGAEFAAAKGINKTTGAVGAFMAFLFLNYNAVVDGALSVGNWGGTGIITAILATFISVSVLDVNLSAKLIALSLISYHRSTDITVSAIDFSAKKFKNNSIMLFAKILIPIKSPPFCKNIIPYS